MNAAETRKLIESYFDAMNAGDWPALLGLLHEDIVHDIYEGGREIGLGAFRRFLSRLACQCREEVRDVEIMVSASGRRAAAEFTVRGSYMSPGEAAPISDGQRYELALGTFFEVEDGRISRVTSYCNMAAWISRVDWQ